MDVLRPRSLEEALALKAARPEAVPIAGGTDLMVELNAGRLRPAGLMDLSRVPELREWRIAGGEVFLGAGVTYATILRRSGGSDVLAQASRTVGSAQVRARGTVGGEPGDRLTGRGRASGPGCLRRAGDPRLGRRNPRAGLGGVSGGSEADGDRG